MKHLLKKKEAIKLAKEFEQQMLNSEEKKLNFETGVKVKIDQVKTMRNDKVEVDKSSNTATAEAKNNLEAKSIELSKNIKDTIDDIVKSDLSSIFKDIYTKYSQFLEGLSLDQIVAIFNLIIDCTLSFSLFSLISLFMGEHLIDYFKLEKNYPSLANLIRLKIQLNKHLRMYNLGFLILFLIFGIFGNLYMFLLNYFV